MIKIILVIIMAVGLVGFVAMYFIQKNQPLYKIGAKVYYRNPIDLRVGRVIKVLKDDIMVETNGEKNNAEAGGHIRRKERKEQTKCSVISSGSICAAKP